MVNVKENGIKLEYLELGNTFHHMPSRTIMREQVSLVYDTCKWNNFCLK